MPLAHVNDIDWHKILEYRDGRLFWKKDPLGWVKEGQAVPLTGDRDGYARVKYRGKTYKQHRVIYEMCYNIKLFPDDVIDHIDGNRLNNLIGNLRCTKAYLNLANRVKHSNTLSGRVGVNWMKNDNKWHSFIDVNGVTIHLGSYHDLQEAILVREAAEKEHRGFNQRNY